MWFIDEFGDAVNLKKASKIEIVFDEGVFFVIADWDTETEFLLKTFDNEDDAKAFVREIVESLNDNGLPLGYSFNWLKAAEKQVSKAKKNDETLIDGVSL